MSRCRRCEPVPQEVRRAADLLGRRWQLVILYACARSEAVRFSELVEAVPGISPRMLSERLRDLEQAGLVERRVARGARSACGAVAGFDPAGRRLEPKLRRDAPTTMDAAALAVGAARVRLDNLDCWSVRPRL